MSETITQALTEGAAFNATQERIGALAPSAPQSGPLVALPGQPASLPQAGTLAFQLQARPKLAEALVKAIKACQAVHCDGEVEFGKTKYSYATSEAILTVARKALAEAGLALVPLEQSVNGHEREGPDRFELMRRFLLLHSSGEALAITGAWPIIPQQGRALDKATAAADTLSLRYLLRDLLLIPAVDADEEVAARDDSGRRPGLPAQKASKPFQPPPAVAPGAPTIGVNEEAEMENLIIKARANRVRLLEVYEIAALCDLPQAHYQHMKDRLLAKIGGSGAQNGTPPVQEAPPDRPTPPAQAASSAAPSATPAPSSAAPWAPDPVVHKTIARIHTALRQLGRSWKQLLAFAGIDAPEGWEEPESLDDLREMERWLQPAQVQILWNAAQSRRARSAGGQKS